MKNLKETIKNACVYTVIITFLFAFIGLFTFDSNASIPLSQFFILMLFGLIIAFAQNIMKVTKLKSSTRYSIHFLTLYVSFMVVFYFTGKITTKGPSGFFVVTVLFALAYFTVILIRYIFQKIRNKTAL